MRASAVRPVGKLGSEQRVVIELHYFADMTFAAIAERTGEALGTVTSRARLALAQLRRAIA